MRSPTPTFEITVLLVVIYMVGMGFGFDIFCCVGTAISFGLTFAGFAALPGLAWIGGE